MNRLTMIMAVLGASALTPVFAADVVPAPDKSGMELTAQEWNKSVIAGWNLGNSLESAPSGWDGNSTSIGWQEAYDTGETGWGNPKTTKAMIDAVKAAGFNAVRIPVRWACHITDVETMTISEAWLARVKEVVDYCIDNDMYVIINTHHDMWLEYQPIYDKQKENNKHLTDLWTQVANYFGDYDGHLAFAGTNEVHIKDNWSTQTAENLAVQNSYNQTFVDAVRATGGKNAYRNLIVQTYRCDAYNGFTNLVIPTDPVEENGLERMSVEFHYYNPYDYCSGANGYNYWGTEYKNKGYKTCNDNEKTMTNFLDRVTNTWASKGLGIVIGEWGISDRWTSEEDKESIHENMTYYCKYFISETRKRGFSTFVWDNNSFGSGSEKYGVFERRNNMNQRASWIVKGIMEGAGQEYVEPEPLPEPDPKDDPYAGVGKVLWSGSGYMSWGDGLQQLLSGSDFSDFKSDSKILFYYTLDPAAEYRMIQFFFGDWSGNPQLIFEGTADKQFDLSEINSGDVSGSYITALSISDSDLKTIKLKGLMVQGFGATLTGVRIVSAEDLAVESISLQDADMPLYDLFGRKVNSPESQQIYIKGSRKVFAQ